MFEIDEQLPNSLIFLPAKVSCSMVVVIHVLRTLCMYVRTYVCMHTYMYVLITIMYASFAQYILNFLGISFQSVACARAYMYLWLYIAYLHVFIFICRMLLWLYISSHGIIGIIIHQKQQKNGLISLVKIIIIDEIMLYFHTFTG